MDLPDLHRGQTEPRAIHPSPERVSTRPWLSVAVLTAVAGFAAALLVIPGTTLLRIYTWDSLAFVDAAYRMSAGQVPHIDFHTPLGFLCSALPYWGLLLSGSPAGAMPMALALALAILTPVLLYVSATRLHWFVAIPTGIFLLMLSAGPLNIGEDPDLVSMGMFYNRLGWTAIVLMALLGLEPFKESRAGAAVDGAAAGVLLALLMYLKITYAAVAAAWLVLLFVLDGRRRTTVVAAFVVAILAGLSVESTYGLHWPYLQDLFAAGSQDTFGRVLFAVMNSLQDIALAILALGLLAQQRLLSGKDAILAAFFLVSGIFILSQNALLGGLTSTIFVLALCAERFARSSSDGRWRSASLYGGVAMLLVFVVAPTADHAGALARHALAGFRAPVLAVNPPQELAGFVIQDRGLSRVLASERGEEIRSQTEAGNFQDLRHDAPPLQQLFQSEYLFALSDGVEALKRLGPDGQSVMVLDFANPFSFALKLPPPRGDAMINHVDRLLSRARPIAAERYLSSATFVMVPHVPVEAATREYLLEVYTPYLDRNFRTVDKTQYWTVLRRVEHVM